MQTLLEIILSPETQKAFMPLQIIAWAIVLACYSFLVYFLMRSNWARVAFLYDFRELVTGRIYRTRELIKTYRKIDEHGDRFDKQTYWKTAARVAYLFERLLERIAPLPHITSPSEKIKYIGPQMFSNIEELIKTQKIFDQIKGGQIVDFTEENAKYTLSVYRQALVDLGILEQKT